MKNYIILGNHTDYCEFMCMDVLNMENVYFENTRDFLRKPYLRIIRKVHLSQKVNAVFNLPYKEYWYSKYIRENQIKSISNNVFIIFDSNTHVHDEGYINYLKQKYNGIIVLVLLNTISTIKSHNREYFKKNYDLIYTTDINDADHYNYKYLEGIYSKLKSVSSYSNSNAKVNEVFFVGDNKGRISILHKIAEKLRTHKISYFMSIINVSKDTQIDNSIIYNSKMSYNDVVRNVLNSNCLLEVVQDEQTGLTLRAIEAVVYNKKLITNNTKIVNSKFYNSKIMSIYSCVDDIDIEFIRKSVDINYYYDHEYSPQRLLEDIELECSEEKT